MDENNKRMPLHTRISQPQAPEFGLAGSISSILSLIFMSVLSTVMFLHLISPEINLIGPFQPKPGDNWLGNLLNYLAPPDVSTGLAPWTWIPFLFSIFGATLGWIFELGLVFAGTPFQQTKSPFTRLIQKIRFLNLAPVATSIFFFVCTMMIPDPTLRLVMMCISGAACTGLGFALFFGGGGLTIPMMLMGAQIVQFIIILCAGIPIGGSFLIMQAVLQLVAFVIGTATPLRSTGFHVLSTFSGVMLYCAILQATNSNAGYSYDVAILLTAGSVAKWAFIVSGIVGLLLVIKCLPLVYGQFRTYLSATIWTPLYFALAGGPRFPDPYSLEKAYKEMGEPEVTPLAPYYIVHPTYLLAKLGIPAVKVADIEASVTIFTKLVSAAKKLFKLLQFLDHNVPQANLNIPIQDKQRMRPGSDGSEYWPVLFSKSIFGLSIPSDGQYLQKPPEPLMDAFEQGQLFAYLAQFGVANPLLELAPEHGEGVLKIDLRFLEKYETKVDYEPYGGIAYFKASEQRQKLELISVIAPNTQSEIMADPNNPTFRHAEGLVLASLYYQVISGKHLAEIHMTYNLVEVSMHNAFDAQRQWNHPFRTFLYLHFFSHEMAEEITTEHLVQEGAVFSQMFATTHNGLVQHLTDSYTNFEYGKDEDFEARESFMRMPDGQMLPNNCVSWEADYFHIWQGYTTSLIDIIYADDQAVKDDQCIQDFHACLLEVMLNGLPQRYEGFQTKKGIARFATDTIHHMVIRHQVYGTTGIKAALDPRIGQVQVPKDMGTYPVNEWRALAYVALATGHSRFTLLAGKEGKDFTYLLEDVDLDQSKKMEMAKVFDKLQADLIHLDAQWTEDDMEKVFNYDYFRAVPSELHTGPGY